MVGGIVMDLEQDLVFCFIEEDNIQRAYFRVRPLLTIQGDVQEEAVSRWPDDGCLRIVPDRNEQHTFKDRMRTLGSYCLMDITGFPADANKIRTNKNYSPEKGEKNQFILYSDTIKPLPEHTFYEAIECKADDYAAAAQKAITPLFFIADDATLYGPVAKAAPEKPENAKEAEATLYPLVCPDGSVHTMLCMKDQPKEAAPAPAEEPLPIGKPLQILDQTKDFEATLQSLDQPLSQSANLLKQPEAAPAVTAMPVPEKPLTGTPLFKAPMRTSVPQPKNKLQEVVSAQWRVAKNEPPTSPLPVGAKMHTVENPVQVACDSMRAAWQVPEARTQLIDFLLSLDGMPAKLEPKLTESARGTALQKALQARLEDMEAERLLVLLQLDKAKADLDAYRRSVIDGLSEKTKAETNALLKEKAEHEAALAALKQQENALVAQRDELLRRIDELQHALPDALAKALTDAQLAAPVHGTPLRMSPVSGQEADPERYIARVMETCAASGVNIQRNQAVAMLSLACLCPRMGIATFTPAPVATLITNIAAALGWRSGLAQQITPEQKPVLSVRPASSTPALLLTTLAAYAPLEGISKILLARTPGNLTRNPAYELSSWPVLTLPDMPAVPALSISGEPLSPAPWLALAEDVPADAAAVLEPMMKQLPPLSGQALKEMQRFIAVGAKLMEGGLAAALDWAILLWLIPAMDRSAKTVSAVKPLLGEFPLSFAKL